MEVVVTGIGLVSAVGASLEATWLRLIASESGVDWRQPFPGDRATLPLPPRPMALIGGTPTQLAGLTQRVVAAALKDAGLMPPLPECGVAIGSSRSHQGQWEQLAQEWGSRQASTSVSWLETLPHMGAIAAARQIGSRGPVAAPMAACATGIWAIAQAFEFIQTGQCQRAIAGAVEAPITPLTLIGFNQMGALAKTGAYPFDRQREGLVLGEGAAVLVLESAELANQREARIYGQVLGFGLTNDACHANAPDMGGDSAIAAVKQCLKRSHLSLRAIDYIHAHGTGTQLNDRCEAQLIQHLFPKGVPVSSTKGSTGHTLGASGALGAAFCLMALKHQLLPPCVGLNEPEFDLDWVRTSRWGKVERSLCLSFGFGGQNAAIALGKMESNG